MKAYKILFGAALMAMTISACTKSEPEQEQKAPKSSDTTIKSVVAYCPSAERTQDDLTASMDKATNTITLTTEALFSNQTPVDLTNVIVELSLATGAKSDLKSSYDLDGKTATLTITAEDDSTSATWTLCSVRTEAMVVIPKTVTVKVDDVWSRSAMDLGLKSPLWGGRGMCAYRENNNDYLYILDNVLPYSEENRIRVHNAKTGNYIQDVETYEGGWNGARSYTWAIDTDDEGHIAMTRLNADQAGFWLDLYDNATNGWTYLGSPLKYAQNQEGLTYYAGKKMQAVGNLVTGQGQIIASCGHFYGIVRIQADYNVFNFVDGVPAEAITAMTYPLEWTAGEFQQESFEDPTLYVTVTDEATYGTDPEETWADLHASHFEIYDPVAGTTVTVLEDCFNYRILASKVFNCGAGKYLYTLEQKYSCIGAYVERLYYISDKDILKNVSATSEEYSKFMLWEHEDDMGGDSGDHRFGQVAVLPDESGAGATVFAYHPSDDSEKSYVSARHITFTEEY